MSKRERLVDISTRSGLVRLLEFAPSRPSIIVLNHHRIGDASICQFDRGVITASAEEFEQQVRFINKRFPVISVAEMLELLRPPLHLKHTCVMWTFDDGYLDNYELALPILQAHRCVATFFLVSEFVGSAAVPWWDEIAYLVRRCERQYLELTYPESVRLPLGAGREMAIQAVLQRYKSVANSDPSRFIAELREATEVTIPAQPQRFLGWKQARQMSERGMDLGSHTCSHAILGKMDEAQQLWELRQSKQCIEEQTGATVQALAYPVGSKTAFSETTQRLARDAGYDAAFSFYGGVNIPTTLTTDLRRMEPPREMPAFAFENVALSRFGRLPY